MTGCKYLRFPGMINLKAYYDAMLNFLSKLVHGTKINSLSKTE